MNFKVSISKNNLNKELIASNITQHDYMNKLLIKGIGKKIKVPLTTTSAFGKFPK